MHVVLEQPQITFFEDSPILTPEEMRQRTRTWEAGQDVYSCGVAIGSIALSPEHESILGGLTRRYEYV